MKGSFLRSRGKWKVGWAVWADRYSQYGEIKMDSIILNLIQYLFHTYLSQKHWPNLKLFHGRKTNISKPEILIIKICLEVTNYRVISHLLFLMFQLCSHVVKTLQYKQLRKTQACQFYSAKNLWKFSQRCIKIYFWAKGQSSSIGHVFFSVIFILPRT